MELFVATNGLSVWRSADAGETLERMPSSSGLYSGSRIWALAHHPAAPRTLLAGTDGGIARLDRDEGCWHPMAGFAEAQLVTAIAYAPHDPRVILAGTQPAALHRSSDGGLSWRQLPTAIPPYRSAHIVGGRISEAATVEGREPTRHWTRITQILVDRHDPTRLWASVEVGGLWRSRDGGESWEKTGEGQVSEDVHALAQLGGDTLAATTNEGFHLSRDGGTRWRLQETGAPWPYVRSLLAHTDDPDLLLMTSGDGAPGADGRLLRSRDGGIHWETAAFPAPLDSSLYWLAADPAQPKLIFAATALGQLFRSRDGGESWQPLKRRLGEIRALLCLEGRGIG